MNKIPMNTVVKQQVFIDEQTPMLTDDEITAIEVARRCLLPCHDDFDAIISSLLKREKDKREKK